MLSGESIEVDNSAGRAEYEAEWKAVHHRLRDLARQRVMLEAEESSCLLEAEELHVFRRLGYTTMVEYMTRELGYSRHAANERLRVAHELVQLPALTAEYRAGNLCFSKVRELTRVATPQTERAFIAEADGKTSRQVAELVSGLRRGDAPDAPKDPALITWHIGLDLDPEAKAAYLARREELEIAVGRRLTDSELVLAMLHGRMPLTEQGQSIDVTTADAPAPTYTRPAAQQLFVTCKQCHESELITDGERVPINASTAARLCCDTELVGDADTDDRSRVTSVIPAAIRRKVLMRDSYQCRVPGCTARKHLDVHHIQHREHGGTHTVRNLLVLCSGHHAAHHDDLLEITGHAPHDVVFTWLRDDDVDSAMRSPRHEGN